MSHTGHDSVPPHHPILEWLTESRLIPALAAVGLAAGVVTAAIPVVWQHSERPNPQPDQRVGVITSVSGQSAHIALCETVSADTAFPVTPKFVGTGWGEHGYMTRGITILGVGSRTDRHGSVVITGGPSFFADGTALFNDGSRQHAQDLANVFASDQPRSATTAAARQAITNAPGSFSDIKDETITCAVDTPTAALHFEANGHPVAPAIGVVVLYQAAANGGGVYTFLATPGPAFQAHR